MIVEESKASDFVCPILTAGNAHKTDIHCLGNTCMFWVSLPQEGLYNGGEMKTWVDPGGCARNR